MSPTGLPAELRPRVSGDPERIGPFRVAGRLGSGGMGVVYGAVDEHGANVAVKAVHAEYAADTEFRLRFAREVELVQRVRARCTPAFAGADTEADTPWLATEYVPGPTLREHVQREGPLEDGMLTALAAGLAEALHAIHAAGVVHRDLKPGNVILAERGPVVLDFGIAHALDATRITRTGGLVGSPGWIAPERYDGAEATAASDVFAWGGLVAFAATGRNPFGSGAPNVVAARTMNQAPDLSGVPEALLPPAEAALAKDPGCRPPTEALVAELGRFSTDERRPQTAPTQALTLLLDRDWQGPIDAVRDRDWRRHTRRPSRFRARRTMAAAGGAALLGLALVAAIATADTWWPSGTATSAPDGNPDSGTEPTADSGEVQAEPRSDPDLTGNTAGIGEFTTEDPGVFHQVIDGQDVLEITMEEVSGTGSTVEIEGRFSYLANSGTREASTGLFYFPDPASEPGANPREVPFEIATPGEVFGVLSPDNQEIQFNFDISAPWAAIPGVLFLNSGEADADPYLCFRNEPYAETGTQFLHNAGDAWTDCAEDPYD